MILNKIGKIIKEKTRFAIACHTSPDGDSLGSMLGLYICLLENGKQADVFVEDTVPEKYRFLPQSDEIRTAQYASDKYECLFVLDCGDPERIGCGKDLMERSDLVVNIDHHLSNDLYGHINYVDTNASSVGEIIYQLLKMNGMDVSRDAASCLYTSIIADTGGFKYSNTTSITMSIAGDLINTGINFSEINNRVFDIKTIPQIKLISKVTSSLSIHLDGSVAAIHMTKAMLDECEAVEADADELVNYARDVQGVEVGLFLKEKSPTLTRVSLRSKSIADVRTIAEKFGGGGHMRAAGCSVHENVAETLRIIMEEIKHELEVKQHERDH